MTKNEYLAKVFAKVEKVEVYQVTVKGEPMSKTEAYIVSTENGK